MLTTSYVNTIFYSISYSCGNILIDPGDEWEGFENVAAVLLTHAHFDHIYGLNELVRVSPNTLVYTNEAGREMLLNAKKNMSYYHETPFVFEYPEKIVVINDGDEVKIGEKVTAKAVFTPGHNLSCITWIIEDAIFTGDSYIPGVKTVTNLPSSNKELAKVSEELILHLAENHHIYPGHFIH